jgi:hypothetical protein
MHTGGSVRQRLRRRPGARFVVVGLTLPKPAIPKPGLWLVEPRGSEHGMIEHIEVFCAHIELDPFRQVETAAQREVGLVNRVGAAQTVPGVRF